MEAVDDSGSRDQVADEESAGLGIKDVAVCAAWVFTIAGAVVVAAPVLWLDDLSRRWLGGGRL